MSPDSGLESVQRPFQGEECPETKLDQVAPPCAALAFGDMFVLVCSQTESSSQPAAFTEPSSEQNN